MNAPSDGGSHRGDTFGVATNAGAVITTAIGLGTILVVGTTLAVVITGILLFGICAFGLWLARHGRSPRLAVVAGVGLAVSLVVTSWGGYSIVSASATTAAPTTGQLPSTTSRPSPITPPPTTASPSNTATDPPAPVDSGTPTATSPAPLPMPSLMRVTLGALCHSLGAVVGFCSPDYRGTVQVGDQVFRYYAEANTAEPPQWSSFLEFPMNTTCTQIVIRFAATYQGPLTINARVTQTGTAPVTAKTQTGHIGVLDVRLNGGPFNLQWNSGNGTALFADGYALCRTDSGQ